MKKAIYAVWCHVSSSEKDHFHVHCPVGPNSWCSYQCDLANGTSTYKPGKGLHPAVIKYVKGVFDDLSSDELSSKCLHGKTQNQNEAFNGTIWTRIPKTKFVAFKVFELSVLGDVAHFNIGNLATLLIFDKLGIKRGYYAVTMIKYVLTIPNEKAWTVQKVVDVFFVACEKTRATKQKSWRGLYGGGKF